MSHDASPQAVADGGWLFNFFEEEGVRAQPDESDVERLIAVLSANARKCRALGIAYIPALVPRKREAIAATSSSKREWVAALQARLRDEDEVELVDLLGVLRDDGARHGASYNRTDADWNDRGAFFVASTLLKEAHRKVPALCPPTLADLHVRLVKGYRGSLADVAKLKRVANEWEPCESEVEAETGVLLDPSPLRALRMPVESHLAEAAPIHLRVYATPQREEEARLAVVGDSAALSLIPWLAERTSRTTFFWTDELPLLQLELEQPRVVLQLMREADRCRQDR
jgi:SGNH hydrolase-like domain, acetyltransferase AlgX